MIGLGIVCISFKMLRTGHGNGLHSVTEVTERYCERKFVLWIVWTYWMGVGTK